MNLPNTPRLRGRCPSCHKPLERVHRSWLMCLLPLSKKLTCSGCGQNFYQVLAFLLKVK